MIVSVAKIWQRVRVIDLQHHRSQGHCEWTLGDDRIDKVDVLDWGDGRDRIDLIDERDRIDQADGVVNTVTPSPPIDEESAMAELFDKRGGFRRLHSFTLATIVQVETLRFCRRFLTFDHREAGPKFYDPKGRQYDQMTQAARSGRQNIIEGSERSATSKDTEMKLTDVARASLSELRGDYEILILDRNQLPWSAHSPEAK
ncbi:MAG: four helix bundle protein, partial [Planctomycetaceae bacterium]